MKKLQRNLLVTLSIASLMFASCSNDDNADSSADDALTNQEAALIVEQSVSPESGGIVTEVEQAVYVTANPESTANTPAFECNQNYANSFEASYTGDNIQYMHVSSWDWTLTCTALGIPSDFTFDYLGNTTYTTNTTSSSVSDEGSVDLSGLELVSDIATANITISRVGEMIYPNRTLNHSLVFSATELSVSKSQYLITGGEMNFSLTGTSSNGGAFDIGGTITFLGNQSAIISFQNGYTQTISW